MKKQWYESKTVWAGGLLVIGGILNYMGVNIMTPEVITALTGLGIIGLRTGKD